MVEKRDTGIFSLDINNVSVHRNGGFLPDIILLTLCYYYHRGILYNPFNPIKCFCPYSQCPHLNVFLSLTGWMLYYIDINRRFIDAFRFSLKRVERHLRTVYFLELKVFFQGDCLVIQEGEKIIIFMECDE